ncbi:P-loop containing nucleoside triphosphate hydrolases superfamily protein [Prunus dulcis]|uniref:Kinesin-like protein n=1 Tax=Prunus dulcis TaxID=3755 RepID=A0A4Y1QTC4_PRUDU|nr:P-loop containing nucleoside triphosphate hydrolases superfamily protein [Prunus dulcis]
MARDSVKDSMEKICVAVRVRPPVSQDVSNGGTFWKVDDNRISLHKPHGTPISGVSYAFDHVFDEGCTNSRVYELLTKDIIHAAVEGFNGTAFAYGQTSSGKTFTMNGSEKDPGIIHRAVRDVFDRIQMISHREFLIRVSYMEIYNEEINDLFAVENQKLQIHESLERGIFVAGLREEIVSNAEQVLKLIESGEVNRHFGETNMNARSSRSHTIFRMVIESNAKDTSSSIDAIRVSVLNLVDLAGSERIAKTGAGGVRLKEGKYINKSLMILGNVINKLSDGAKNRGHIPYRDSKLTRILQPALGGNAKTSIICTIAPEEVHIEETKGTLQFASRAKRITNCAQVNEILTDAALLKRQKQEIEELRKKLQGSHAGVLEQEVLKLRNDLLQYELEREKLEMELEEQRKSHKQREQCIRDQQIQIDNLGSLSTTSDLDRSSSQAQDSGRQSLKEDGDDSYSKSQGDLFRTPSLKAVPHSFVVKRSNYSPVPGFSPLPDSFSNVVDEDMWFKMNKGFVADLDSLQMTPSRTVQSFPPSDETAGSKENYKQEVQNLKRQLELAIEERDDLMRKHAEQVVLNDRLVSEISELQNEAQLIREIPRRLSECAATCKDIYVDVLSKTQSFLSDEKTSAAKLVSSISEIGTSLFTTLETHFSVAFGEGQRSFSETSSLIQEQREVLSERLNSTIKLLVSSERPRIENEQGCATGGENACWKEKLSNELITIKERYHGLEEELDSNNQLLEKSKQRYDALEAEFQLLKEERDSLHKMVSESSQTLALATDQKENVLKDLNNEVLRRKDLEEKIKEFSVAFGCRKTLLMSFHSEFKSKIESLRAKNPASVPKSVGC